MKKWDGVLRCLICGKEQRRVGKGLNYGFPKCCEKTMAVITPQMIHEEQEFYRRTEDEENFVRSATGGELV